MTEQKIGNAGRISVLGVPFDAVTFYEAGTRVRELVRSGGRGYVVTPNAVMVERAGKDERVARLLRSAFLCVPDGVGVIRAAELLGTPLPEQIPGVELGEALLALAASDGWRVFFFGGKPGIAEQAADSMKKKYPGLSVVGCAHGYSLKQGDGGAVTEAVNASGAELLFVCLGFPLQETWIAENLPRMPSVRVALALGGSLDVYAGTVPRAPAAVRKAGMEWLYRMAKDPSKIGRSGDLLRFAGRTAGAVIRKKRQEKP